MIRFWLRCRRGATSIEYALIASLVSIAIIGGLTSLGSGTNGLYGLLNSISNKLGG